MAELMNRTALITGATVGIGNAYARFLAARGYDLVLVARDEGRLHGVAEELRAKFGVQVEPFRADLSRYDETAWVEQRLADPQRPIDVLINNAGYGLNRKFTNGDLLAEQAMCDVLCRAVLRLSHAAALGMKERGRGTIINVSSVAGWWPYSTYSAAKSYVTAFTQNLHNELKPHGVKVSAVCPGYTRTEFHSRGGFSGKQMQWIPSFLWLDADQLVAESWADAERNKAISVPGRIWKVLVFLMRRIG
jgi:short-subunit dehydrogenase